MNMFRDTIKLILKMVLTYLIILLGVVSAYVFFNFGRISFEQVFIVDDTILQMTKVKYDMALIIITALSISLLIFWLSSKKLNLFLCTSSLLSFIFVFSICEYIKYNVSYSDFYENEYKPVSIEDVSFPQNKRNLIVIYLESMERDYNGTDVKPFLDDLKKSNIYFDGFKQLKSTHMTLGAHFSSLCGLPLRNVTANKDLLNFLPNTNCVPDILKKYGYNLSFLKAADIKFSGTGLLAKQHSFDNIKGVDELRNDLQKRFKNIEGNTFGGISDRMLFEAAKTELQTLPQPFMLALTTLDMHDFPEYFVDPQCVKKFGDIRDAVNCTDYNVKNFLIWLQKQDFFKNTSIVLVGDHTELGVSTSNRQIFNVFINTPNNLKPEKSHLWTTYDLAPSLLNVIGVDVSHFGLGRSLFKGEKTLLEKYKNNFDFYLMAKNRLHEKLYSDFNVEHKYTPYTLGSIIKNKDIHKYSDISDNSWCYMTSLMSLNIEKPKNNLSLSMDITSMSQPFDIFINGHLVYAHKYHRPNKEKLSIIIDKNWINNDGNLVIEVKFDSYNRNIFSGICINNFVIK